MTTINKYEERVLQAHANLKLGIANRVETIKKIDAAVVRAQEKITALNATLATADPLVKADLEKLIVEQNRYIEHAKEWKPREEQMLQNLYLNEEFFKQHVCPHASLEMTDISGKHRCLICSMEL